MNASAAVAGGYCVKDSLRIATREVKEILYDARCSMWAVLSGIVLSLVSSELLLTGRELSLLEQSEVLAIVTRFVIGLGLLVAGILAADSEPNERERATLKSALLLGKVWGVIATWLLIFAISVPYIVVVGFGTSVSWAALIYTFVLGSLCVAGFASLLVGISALSRSGRSVKFASMAVVIAMAASLLLSTTSQKSSFSVPYNVLSPVAHARLSLDSVIVGRESLVAQLPHIGALAAFVTITTIFAAFATTRGVSSEGW